MRIKFFMIITAFVSIGSWAKAESSARSVELSVTVHAPPSESAKESGAQGRNDDKTDEKPSKPSMKYYLAIIREGQQPAHSELKKGESLKPEEVPQAISLGSHADDFKKTIEVPDGTFSAMLFGRTEEGPCAGLSESSFKNAQGCLPMPSKWHCEDFKISSAVKTAKSVCLQGSEK